MTGILVPDLLRPWLLPSLQTRDVFFLCCACRVLREELRWLRVFSVKFSRELFIEEDVIESLGQTICGMPCLRHLSVCLAYQYSSTFCCTLATRLQTGQLVELALDMRYCNLGDEGIQELTKTILQQRNSLTLLHLRLSFNQISRKGAQNLANALKEGTRMTDVVLDVDINPIADGAILLLHSLGQVHRLRLDMAHCNIGDAIAEELASVLRSLVETQNAQSHLQSLELDLRGNRLIESKPSIVKAAACLSTAGCKCLSRLD
eukprot:Skav229274  [mRNA]  locus=scaffold952:268065:268850:- [translate_table: standard]